MRSRSIGRGAPLRRKKIDEEDLSEIRNHLRFADRNRQVLGWKVQPDDREPQDRQLRMPNFVRGAIAEVQPEGLKGFPLQQFPKIRWDHSFRLLGGDGPQDCQRFNAADVFQLKSDDALPNAFRSIGSLGADIKESHANHRELTCGNVVRTTIAQRARARGMLLFAIGSKVVRGPLINPPDFGWWVRIVAQPSFR